MQPENADTVTQALALFHAGQWAQALPVLRQAVIGNAREATAEVSAALGICEGFSTGPLEPGSGVVAWESLERVASLLHQGEPTGWSEVSACQAWLQLLQASALSPAQIPPTLDRLVGVCQQSRWFPIWSLAFRALAYYDRRQAIWELLTQAVGESANGPCGPGLVLAEAALECAYTVSADSLLQDFDVHACLPLAPEVAHLWRQWLLAEWAWWKAEGPKPLDRMQATVADLLETPAPESDPYSRNEWGRLTHRIALLGARCALSQRAGEKARQWIELAARSRPESWESQYLSGLVAWSLGEYREAQAHLQQSLAENPFQSRVRFELGMLRSSIDLPGGRIHLEAIPAVYDALSSTAVALFRLGQGGRAEVRRLLEQLDQTEEPYSLRLIWPRARTFRLRQGRELRAHLAEASQDWLEALKYWDAARRTGLPPREVAQYDAPVRIRNLAHRTHRLYLLGQYLRQRNAADGDESDKMLYNQFQKELGKLSIHPLMGEAMFYRGLAAEGHMLDRAIADWRALLRQTAWVEKTQKIAPSRLLGLGDRLLRAGLSEDAHRAYGLASVTSIAGAEERLFVSGLITQLPLEATGLLQALEAADTLASDDGLWLFLRGLCLLAQEPPDCKVAQSLLEQAHQAGLPARLERLSELLPALTAAEPGAGQQIRSFLDEGRMDESGMAALPPTLQLGLETLCRPEGLETLCRFKETFGADWMAWRPVSPAETVDRQLRDDCTQFGYAAALDQIQEAEGLGVYVSDEWKAFLHASQAIRMALRGDFEAAEAFQQQALKALSPDLREVQEVNDR